MKEGLGVGEIGKDRIRPTLPQLFRRKGSGRDRDRLGPNRPGTGHIMRGISNDKDSVGRKDLPMPLVGPSLGMRAQLVAHGGIIRKSPKLKKMVHPIPGQFQTGSFFNVSRQQSLDKLRSTVSLLQDP